MISPQLEWHKQNVKMSKFISSIFHFEPCEGASLRYKNSNIIGYGLGVRWKKLRSWYLLIYTTPTRRFWWRTSRVAFVSFLQWKCKSVSTKFGICVFVCAFGPLSFLASFLLFFYGCRNRINLLSHLFLSPNLFSILSFSIFSFKKKTRIVQLCFHTRPKENS